MLYFTKSKKLFVFHKKYRATRLRFEVVWISSTGVRAVRCSGARGCVRRRRRAGVARLGESGLDHITSEFLSRVSLHHGAMRPWHRFRPVPVMRVMMMMVTDERWRNYPRALPDSRGAPCRCRWTWSWANSAYRHSCGWATVRKHQSYWMFL